MKRKPYERLKEAILSGELVPGQPLVEAVLAEWCEVSRTPIREALSKLQQDGLVQRGERGMVVRQNSPEEILDIYETRIALEVTAARMAAERRSSHDLMAMRRSAQRMAEARDLTPAEMSQANVSLHRAVWKASRNESLIDLLERLNLHLVRYPETTLSQPGRWDSSNKEHEALLSAIEKRDADVAAEVARRHFSSARDIRLALWDQM